MLRRSWPVRGSAVGSRAGPPSNAASVGGPGEPGDSGGGGGEGETEAEAGAGPRESDGDGGASGDREPAGGKTLGNTRGIRVPVLTSTPRE